MSKRKADSCSNPPKRNRTDLTLDQKNFSSFFDYPSLSRSVTFYWQRRGDGLSNVVCNISHQQMR